MLSRKMGSLAKQAVVAMLALVSGIIPLTQTRADEPKASELPGHYYLSGVMEVGSELLLTSDGQFKWMLAYGATDVTAFGHWVNEGQSILLTNEDQSTDGPPAFNKFRMTINADGTLTPQAKGLNRGVYSK